MMIGLGSLVMRWTTLLICGAWLVIGPASLFAQTAADSSDATFLPGCQWKDQTVIIHGKANQQLSFRYQECTSKDLPKVVYALNEREELIQSWGGDHGGPVAQFWALN